LTSLLHTLCFGGPTDWARIHSTVSKPGWLSMEEWRIRQPLALACVRWNSGNSRMSLARASTL